MRITQKDLESVVSRINRICGTPETPYAMLPDGSFAPKADLYNRMQAFISGLDVVK